MLKVILITLITLLSVTGISQADSPLTSTDFSKAYQKERIVIAASKTHQVLTKKLMRYLVNKKKPIDIKIALINELGWSFNGLHNADLFFSFLKKKKGYDDDEDFIHWGSGDELLCMAYLTAMDNYFDVTKAIYYLSFALKKSHRSYTYHIISALIYAQNKLHSGDWCEVYKSTNAVRKDKNLKIDMIPKAIDIIFDYIENYKEYCKVNMTIRYRTRNILNEAKAN